MNIVCGGRPWCKETFDICEEYLEGEWAYVTSPAMLLEYIDQYNSCVEHIFFVHWSWIVPETVYSKFNCIVFHPSDVPYGRGGTPVQTLIQQGFTETMLSAIEMTGEIDAGPVYLKRPLSLVASSAEEIYVRMARVAASMIVYMYDHGFGVPQPQAGAIATFKRRTPKMSEMPVENINTLEEAYDFIRMLDAQDYPAAFLTIGNLRLEFRRVVYYHDRLVSDVVIRVENDS